MRIALAAIVFGFGVMYAAVVVGALTRRCGLDRLRARMLAGLSFAVAAHFFVGFVLLAS